MKKITAFLIAIIACSMVELYAQIIHVPADQPTIQAGINIASDGDTVLVDTGTYFENINFRGKAITVASKFINGGDTTNINNTIIDGSNPIHPDSASVVMFTSGEDSNSVICGFTLINGTGLYINSLNKRIGGGIACLDAGAKISNNKIMDNEIVHDNESSGGGIGAKFLTVETWIVIQENIIKGNRSISTGQLSNGGAIYMATNARIDNNTIAHNESHCNNGNVDGGGIMIENLSSGIDTVYLRNNLINHNIISASGRGRGGGIFSLSTKTSINSNTISYNSVFANVANGSGVLCNSNKSLDITENIICFNTAHTDFAWFGAGILCYFPQGDCNFSDNWFEGNSGPIYSTYPQLINQGNGGGMCILDPFFNKVIIDGNFYKNDTAKFGGGCYIRDAWNITLSNNVFTDNFAYDGGAMMTYETSKKRKGSGIMAYGFDPLLVNNSCLRNNAINEGGAVFSLYAEFPPVILNNIFWECNAGSAGHDICLDGAVKVLVANCVTTNTNISGNFTAKDNIYADPMFADTLCHLDSLSPCLNTGLDSIMVDGTWYHAPLQDRDGNPRPDTICYYFDMGAYEKQGCNPVGAPDEDHLTSAYNLKVYPNPFLSLATIEIELESGQYVEVKILNQIGQQIEWIDLGYHTTNQSYIWNASGLPAGMYIVQVRVGKEIEMWKVIKLK